MAAQADSRSDGGARFAGKVALITGAAGGIGRAAAVRFASEGAQVGLVDLSAEGLRETLAAVEQAGGRGVTVRADVTRADEVARYASTVADRLGGVDCFFNNAGILGEVRRLVDYPEEMFDRVMAVNVKGVWLGMKTVAPLLRARGGGAIVNTASIAGLHGSRVPLVAYTGPQVEGFELAKVPEGYEIQGSDAFVLTLAQPGDDSHYLAFDGKDWSTISVPDGKTVNLTAQLSGVPFRTSSTTASKTKGLTLERTSGFRFALSLR